MQMLNLLLNQCQAVGENQRRRPNANDAEMNTNQRAWHIFKIDKLEIILPGGFVLFYCAI